MAPAPTLLHLGVHFCVFLVLRGSLGLQLDTTGRHFGDLGIPLGCFFDTLGRGPEPFQHFQGKGVEKVPKIVGLGSPAGSILMILCVFL